MKKVTLLFAFGSLLMCSGLYAQEEKEVEISKVEVSEEDHDQRMKEELDLSEEQQKEMKAIKKKYAAKEEALRKEMKELREQKHKEMKAVLTPEQQKKADEMHKEHMKRKKVKKVVRKKKMKEHREEMHK